MAKPTRLSAGTILVRETPDGPRFLVLRAYRNWDFPKGLVAAGEEPLEAALRETAEETGIEDVLFPWGPVYVETPPYAGNKVARYYLASTSEERVALRPSAELGRPEHHEFRWVDADTARALLAPRVRAVLEWAIRRMTEPPDSD
ncbi:MAG TPA: NUDIX domain-containing protein [Gammaproteobacteria bacterium]|nr:NUDIX domain-containing protein [Gammaproteobacteria bacterium]